MSGFQLKPTPTASNHPPAAGVSGVSATPAKTTTTTMMPTPLQKTPGGISTVGNTHIHTHTLIVMMTLMMMMIMTMMLVPMMCISMLTLSSVVVCSCRVITGYLLYLQSR